jgi:hypothetical protein
MNALSIDLAYRRYSDFGLAFLPDGSIRPVYPLPEEIGLEGVPSPGECARIVDDFCDQRQGSILLLDGPQGWRHPASAIVGMRLCERVLNTPGRTGLPGLVEPKGYLPFVRFSIQLFHDLRTRSGWVLMTENRHSPPAPRLAAEGFPSSAWALHGMVRLPAKRKVGRDEVAFRAMRLSEGSGLEIPAGLTHDQVQTSVVLACRRRLRAGIRGRSSWAGTIRS